MNLLPAQRPSVASTACRTPAHSAVRGGSVRRRQLWMDRLCPFNVDLGDIDALTVWLRRLGLTLRDLT